MERGIMQDERRMRAPDPVVAIVEPDATDDDGDEPGEDDDDEFSAHTAACYP
jgi:hypothetical protein